MTTQQIEHQNQPKTHSLIEPLTQEAIDKVIQLLDEWMDDDSGYDEETWPELKEALDTERDFAKSCRILGRCTKARSADSR